MSDPRMSGVFGSRDAAITLLETLKQQAEAAAPDTILRIGENNNVVSRGTLPWYERFLLFFKKKTDDASARMMQSALQVRYGDQLGLEAFQEARSRNQPSTADEGTPLKARHVVDAMAYADAVANERRRGVKGEQLKTAYSATVRMPHLSTAPSFAKIVEEVGVDAKGLSSEQQALYDKLLPERIGLALAEGIGAQTVRWSAEALLREVAGMDRETVSEAMARPDVLAEADRQSLSPGQKQLYGALLQEHGAYNPHLQGQEAALTGREVTVKAREVAVKALRYVAGLSDAQARTAYAEIAPHGSRALNLVHNLRDAKDSREFVNSLCSVHLAAAEQVRSAALGEESSPDHLRTSLTMLLTEAMEHIGPLEARELYERLMADAGAGRELLSAASLNAEQMGKRPVAGAVEGIPRSVGTARPTARAADGLRDAAYVTLQQLGARAGRDAEEVKAALDEVKDRPDVSNVGKLMGQLRLYSGIADQRMTILEQEEAQAARFSRQPSEFATEAAGAADRLIASPDFAELLIQDGPVLPGGYEPDDAALDRVRAIATSEVRRIIKERYGKPLQARLSEADVRGVAEQAVKDKHEAIRAVLQTAASEHAAHLAQQLIELGEQEKAAASQLVTSPDFPEMLITRGALPESARYLDDAAYDLARAIVVEEVRRVIDERVDRQLQDGGPVVAPPNAARVRQMVERAVADKRDAIRDASEPEVAEHEPEVAEDAGRLQQHCFALAAQDQSAAGRLVASPDFRELLMQTNALPKGARYLDNAAFDRARAIVMEEIDRVIDERIARQVHGGRPVGGPLSGAEIRQMTQQAVAAKWDAIAPRLRAVAAAIEANLPGQLTKLAAQDVSAARRQVASADFRNVLRQKAALPDGAEYLDHAAYDVARAIVMDEIHRVTDERVRRHVAEGQPRDAALSEAEVRQMVQQAIAAKWDAIGIALNRAVAVRAAAARVLNAIVKAGGSVSARQEVLDAMASLGGVLVEIDSVTQQVGLAGEGWTDIARQKAEFDAARRALQITDQGGTAPPDLRRWLDRLTVQHDRLRDQSARRSGALPERVGVRYLEEELSRIPTKQARMLRDQAILVEQAVGNPAAAPTVWAVFQGALTKAAHISAGINIFGDGTIVPLLNRPDTSRAKGGDGQERTASEKFWQTLARPINVQHGSEIVLVKPDGDATPGDAYRDDLLAKVAEYVGDPAMMSQISMLATEKGIVAALSEHFVGRDGAPVRRWDGLSGRPVGSFAVPEFEVTLAKQGDGSLIVSALHKQRILHWRHRDTTLLLDVQRSFLNMNVDFRIRRDGAVELVGAPRCSYVLME